jgi:DNA-binding NtrC family response regulator
MIYFIDEDVSQLRSYAMAFELSGYEVQQISNADEGFLILKTLQKNDFILLDVMLRTGDAKDSIFTREMSSDFIQTGIAFLEMAVKTYGLNICKQIAFFTNANQINLLKEVKNAAKRHSVALLSKSDFPSPKSLVNKIEEIMQCK